MSLIKVFDGLINILRILQKMSKFIFDRCMYQNIFFLMLGIRSVRLVFNKTWFGSMEFISIIQLYECKMTNYTQ